MKKLSLNFGIILLLLFCFSLPTFATNEITLSQVKNIDIIVNDQKVEINWKKVNNADGYEVIITDETWNRNWKYDWKYTAMIFNKFPYGNRYNVQIKAYIFVNGNKKYGKVSNQERFVVKDNTPKDISIPVQVTGINIVVNNQKVEINWNKVKNADGYDVIITDLVFNRYWQYDWKYETMIFNKFPYGNNYKVEVRAYNIVNGNKQYGIFSFPQYYKVEKEKITVKKLSKVSNVLTTVSNRSLLIKWNEVKGADGYEVVFTSSNYNIEWIYDWKYESMLFKCFPTGKNYKVQIRAYQIVNNKKEYGQASDVKYFDVI